MNRITAVTYLREHPDLLNASDRDIVRALKTAGIVSPLTYHRDCNIRALVTAAGCSAIRRCPECGRPL